MNTNVLQRTAWWSLAALLAAGSAFGQTSDSAVQRSEGADALPAAAPFAPVGVNLEPGLRRLDASEASLLDRFSRRGFENVRVRTAGDSLLLSFEYRMARGTHAGACEALEIAGRGFDHVVAVLEHQEVPMTALAFAGPSPPIDHVAGSGPTPSDPVPVLDGPCAGYRIVDASMDVRPYVSRLKSGAYASSRIIDFAIHPRYSAWFGFYRDPVMLQINLAPRLNVRLWQGFEIGAQIIIPFYNEFSSEGDYVRPGMLTASQFLRLPGPLFVRATAGTFTNRRFGVDLRARRFFRDGRYWTGVQLGRTGNLFYPNGSIFVERDPEWIALATAGVAWRRHNVYVDGAAGRFLFGDYGGRIEIMRQFRRSDIGFVFTQTVNGANAGLRLIVPFFEGTFAGSRSLRIRPAPDFTWDYMYRAGTNAGEYYETGYYMNRIYQQHQPDFLIDLISSP